MCRSLRGRSVADICESLALDSCAGLGMILHIAGTFQLLLRAFDMIIRLVG